MSQVHQILPRKIFQRSTKQCLATKSLDAPKTCHTRIFFRYNRAVSGAATLVEVELDFYSLAIVIILSTI